MEQSCRHFIAVLGTNFYTDCVYQVEKDGFFYKTPYAQLAVLKYVMPDYREGDRITILLTELSERMNWLDRDYEPREIKILENRGVRVQPKEKKTGFRKILGALFGLPSPDQSGKQRKTGFRKILEAQYPDISLETIRIREGSSQEELDEIFEKIYETIRPGETIYFDITHGLRNIPMQVLTVIHYAKALKEIEVGGVYYGAYEIGENRPDGLRYVNLLDMSMCSRLLDWTSAAQSFVKGGSSNQIWELKESGKHVSEQERAALKSLRDLTGCLNACKGKNHESSERSIQKAYEEFRVNYERLCESHTSISEAPLLRLFDRIEGDLGVFRRKLFLMKEGEKVCLSCTSTGMAAVDWAIRKNLTQLGFTALRETIVTYVSEQYGIPAEDWTVRKLTVWDTLGAMADQYQAVRGRDGGSMDREWFVDRKLMTTPYKKELEELIREVPEELLDVTAGIMKYRDALNDFGFSEADEDQDVIRYQELQEHLRGFYETLRQVMESQGVVFETV